MPGSRASKANALNEQESEARGLKQRLEAMGPVNMMALEEYHETTQRHTFLEAQRKDLLESIDNTAASIKEIDDVSRVKFDEAYKVINEKLFGDLRQALRRRPGLHAPDPTPTIPTPIQAASRLSHRRRARSCRTFCC